MDSGTELILDTLLKTAIQAVAVAGVYFSAKTAVSWIRLGRFRARLTRYLIERGHQNIEFKRAASYRYDVTSTVEGETSHSTFVAIDGGHFLAGQDDQLEKLILFHDDKTFAETKTPNPQLIDGILPHVAIAPRCNTAVSALAGTCTCVLTLVLAILFFYALTPVRIDLPNLSARAEWIYNGIATMVLTFNVIAVYYVTYVATSFVYHATRHRLIFNDGPLCTVCLYDLRGIDSKNCPECGSDLQEFSTAAKNADQESLWGVHDSDEVSAD